MRSADTAHSLKFRKVLMSREEQTDRVSLSPRQQGFCLCSVSFFGFRFGVSGAVVPEVEMKVCSG